MPTETEFNMKASQVAMNVGVSRSTLTLAIREGRCAGENRDGFWYTSEAAVALWYNSHYRHRNALYSDVAGTNWHPHETEKLRCMVQKGVTPAAIAKKLRRSLNAVETAISKLHLEVQPKDVRVRLYLHPDVAATLSKAAKISGVSLAVFVTRAGLAAVADPKILEKGLREAEKIGKS